MANFGGPVHLTVLNDGFAEREPALAQLAATSVAGLAPAGPELRRLRSGIIKSLAPVVRDPAKV